MWINEDGMIDVVSDYNVLVMECMLLGRNDTKIRPKKNERAFR